LNFARNGLSLTAESIYAQCQLIPTRLPTDKPSSRYHVEAIRWGECAQVHLADEVEVKRESCQQQQSARTYAAADTAQSDDCIILNDVFTCRRASDSALTTRNHVV